MRAVKQISAEDFVGLLKSGAHVFDTRTEAQFERDGLPDSRLLSLEQVQAGELPELAKGDSLYLICERGQVSELVGLYLEAAGFSQVYNVAGGFRALRALEKS